MQAASGRERLKFVRWRFSNFTFMETLGAPKLILVVNEFSKYSSLWRMILAPNNISCQHSITYMLIKKLCSLTLIFWARHVTKNANTFSKFVTNVRKI